MKLCLNGTELLNIQEFDCTPGESVCIVGANGSGKSLFLETLYGNYPTASSMVEFQNKNGTGAFKPIDRKDVRISAILQRMCLWSRVRVSELISLFEVSTGLEVIRDEFLHSMRGKIYKNLSTGERQYLYFSLLRNSQSDILLLDEPFSGLDVENNDVAMKALRSHSATKVWTLHDFASVLKLTQRTYLMVRGAMVQMRIVPSDDLRRVAALEICRKNNHETEPDRENTVLLGRIETEIESVRSIELLNGMVIRCLREYDSDTSKLSLVLRLSRSVYEDYRD